MGTRGQDGFSLVDLMIGMVVSMVLIGAVLSVVHQQGEERRSTEEGTLALSAVRNNLELMRDMSGTQILALHGTGFDVPGSNGAAGGLSAVPGDPDGLPGEFAVTVDQVGGGGAIYRVVASVNWSGVSGRRRISLQALVGERK
ncbi:MAG: PilW family protein [Planctomycetota bacterium]|jgi:type II secretory pathway pseudopilin PulG